MFIEGGSGQRNVMDVDSFLRGLVYATNISEMGFAADKTEKAWILASDFINITTTGTFSGHTYVKYTGDKILKIDGFRVCGGASGNCQVKLFAGVTAGTLVDDASDMFKNSSNLSSVEPFPGEAFKAVADAETVTDGSHVSQFQLNTPGHTIQDYSGALILRKNASFAILVKPSVAMDICVEIQCHETDSLRA